MHVSVKSTVMLCALFITTACASSNQSQSFTISRTSNECPSIIITPQTSFNINLDANPSTGFQWQVASKPEILVQQGKGKYVPDNTPERMVGSGGTYTLTFLATKPGQGKLQLVYLQPWETNTPPARRITCPVTVK